MSRGRSESPPLTSMSHKRGRSQFGGNGRDGHTHDQTFESFSLMDDLKALSDENNSSEDSYTDQRYKNSGGMADSGTQGETRASDAPPPFVAAPSSVLHGTTGSGGRKGVQFIDIAAAAGAGTAALLLTPDSATFPPSRSSSSSASSLSSTCNDDGYWLGGLGIGSDRGLGFSMQEIRDEEGATGRGTGGQSPSSSFPDAARTFNSSTSTSSGLQFRQESLYDEQPSHTHSHTESPPLTLTFAPASYRPAELGSSDQPYTDPSLPYSPQPPSLSPMNISTPSFASTFSPHLASPITPISPHSFQSPAYVASPSMMLATENPYAFYTDASHVSRDRHPSYISDASTPDEHARTRLKRVHSDHSSISSAAALTNDIYAQARQAALVEASFIGPLTELDSAALAATSAASKTGAGAGAFVFKVYYMLLDSESQKYIWFAESGKSFIVGNTVEFAREVLPKHFKHKYGFHKVNKTPRGQARAAETQAWEFTHPKFVRGCPQQLDEIKRRATDSEVASSSLATKMTRSMSGALESRRPDRETSAETDTRRPGPMGIPTPLQRPSSTFVLDPTPPKRATPRPRASPPEMSATLANTTLAHDQARAQYAQAQQMVQQRQQQSQSQGQSHIQQPYPSPQSHHHSPLQSIPSAEPARQVPPIPMRLAHPGVRTFSSTSASQPSSRLEMLELQRIELSNALTGTQEGYESLYRELVDTRRKQDSLFTLVRDMYRVLETTGTMHHLPYTFPIHLFPPGTFNPPDNPTISVTPVEHSSHRMSSHHRHHQPYVSAVYDPDPTPSYPNADFYHLNQQVSYSPRDTQAAAPERTPSYSYQPASPRQQRLSAAVINPSGHSHTTTLAPALASFSDAINTPLPASPNPDSSATMGITSSELVGLGLGTDDAGEGKSPYYDHMGLGIHEDVEMSSPAMGAFSESTMPYEPRSSSQPPSRSLMRTGSFSSHPRPNARRPARSTESLRSHSSDYYVKREDDGDVASLHDGSSQLPMRFGGSGL